jgi:predicted permease
MERVWRDVRFGLRTLIKSPTFAAAAVVSLGLGIGVNTAIFTVINTLFLNPLPVQRVGELAAVYTVDSNQTTALGNVLQVSYLNYKDYRDHNSTFTSLAAYSFPNPVSVRMGEGTEQLFIELVTGNYFSTLGVSAARGRVIGPEDDRTPGESPVLVLSHNAWQRRFGGDLDIVGRRATANGVGFTIVGVAPDGFRGINSLFGPDGWAPTMMYRQTLPSQMVGWMDERRALLLNVAGRLKPGVTLEQAGENVKGIARTLEETYPTPNKGRTAVLRPLAQATIFPAVRDALALGGAVLMVIVGLVLLIACSNVANLLLARATSRTQEIAVRLALGANRSRLVRQLLTESIVLGLLGGALGWLVALWGVKLIWAARPPFVAQNFVDPRIDGVVLLFTLGVAILTGVLFGLAPALQASRANMVTSLKDATRGAGRQRRRFGLANMLIVGQVALSVVALITAALFLRSSQAASRIDPGFDTEHVAVMGVSPGQAAYDAGRGEQFYEDVADRLAKAPGVRSVSWSNNQPLFGFALRSVYIEGRDPNAAPVLTITNTVDPGYFATAGIPLQQGRDFTPADRTGSMLVAIVNDAMAKRYWPNEDAIGRRFRYYTDTEFRTVVGIVRTVKYQTLGEPPTPAAYTPLAQGYSDTMFLHVRAHGDPAPLLEVARREIRAIDANVPVQNPLVVKELVRQSLFAVNLAAALLGVFGLLALALASLGLYGVMSYSVGQRSRELGLRMALGAGRSGLMRLVLSQSLTLVGAGVAIGLVGAWAATRAVATLIYGSTLDPVSFIGAPLGLVIVALLASLPPALRASRIDPIVVLRET